MLIRCKHERPGGSLVTFGFRDEEGYRAYNFKARGPKGEDGKPTGPHVAEVADEGDVATLLAIDSAYEEFVEGAALAAATRPEITTKTVLPAPPRKNVAAIKALDGMDEKALREFAADRFPAVKLDAAHGADQLRTYIKGLLEKG